MNQTAEFEAWIDVGGTFTDCFTRQNGKRSECKLLSTGHVPLSISPGPGTLHCPELANDQPGFWNGARLNVFNPANELVASFLVRHAGRGQIDIPVEIDEASSAQWFERTAGNRFELDAGLEAPVLAVRRALQIPLVIPLPAGRIRLGTTRGTNALLTRRGARVVLAITAPFEDLLLIGDQTRPELFALDIRKPQPLAEFAIGIHERLDAQGNMLQELDIAAAKASLQSALVNGCDSLAICLMHAYVNPLHEQQLERLARQLGFRHVSCSHQVAPLIEIVPRAQTTVVDAYLSPIIREYLEKLIEQFGGAESVQLDVMTSAGGLTPYHSFSGKDSILSGPAGGAVALEGIRQSIRVEQLFGLDMGGTSTDVCRVSAEHTLQYESNKAGVRLLTPTLPIETVAAGGGSVCWFDGVALRVGPQSAGAAPGPACYGRGGPLTITDLNVFLGRLPAAQFPFFIDTLAIEQRLDALLHTISQVLPILSREQLAEGFRRLANEQMAGAVSTVSLAQGVDPRGATLVGFGGAAGQHICEIAQLLDIRQIVDVAPAGLLSALGMGLADLRADAAIPVYQLAQECDWSHLDCQTNQVAAELVERMLKRGITASQVQIHVWCELRYQGTDNTLSIARTAFDLAADFHREHERRFGYRRDGRALELVSLRIECIGSSGERLPQANSLPNKLSKPRTTSSLGNGRIYNTLRRSDVQPGSQFTGPVIVLNSGSTLTIDQGWQAECLSDGSLLLQRTSIDQVTIAEKISAVSQQALDPVTRDCLSKRFSSIAQQMGLVLQQTAVSVNVKQRRDFSCAVFDGHGRLLANAPHVPVHLGAMGITVRHVLQQFPSMQPGDCFVTNHPFCGGSHLPDITVITPIIDTQQNAQQPKMFVANRAHHADIGGVAPGSMSVLAKSLDEEGVILSPMHLVAGGRDCSGELAELFRSAPYPPRNIQENMADLAAQQAANQRGVALLHELAESYGWTVLQEASQAILDVAAKRVENFLRDQPAIDTHFIDHMDDHTPLAVHVSTMRPGKLLLSFQGSGEVSPTNLNANPSIVTAAVLYVLRCLIADDMPLNEGVLDCIELSIPPGILNPSVEGDGSKLPAVAAGNVETSQRLVDILLGAFGVAAASQGTMNNLLFGNERFGFYETICGGAGATATQAGASAVHTHMTNTRLTDAEVLELRYPVRLLQFAIRRGSGGEGEQSGGDGVVRELEFLDDVQLSLLTSRRGPYAPFGLQGGQPGRLGCNTLLRHDGTHVELPGCCHVAVYRGDRLRIETPGGGGFGMVRN